MRRLGTATRPRRSWRSRLLIFHLRSSCGLRGFQLVWMHGSREAGLRYHTWVSRLGWPNVALRVWQIKKNFASYELRTTC
jgi:hypothetical protein